MRALTKRRKGWEEGEKGGGEAKDEEKNFINHGKKHHG